ncbi:16S rRNA (cytosine967-C5)-methyltransferase [Alteromonadaceae bacterium 2753L.S.0a.02]|nr:16S rRNA (cytosine967-C5)-methyltransferase [Alteromonadaceae bacterium 2753L.S.0a.02]
MVDIRAQAALTLGEVLSKHCSLSAVFEQRISTLEARERGLFQELCFGTLRWLPRLQFFTKSLLNKPLRNKDQDVHALLLLGLYQMEYLRVPDHAAISETVNASRSLKKPWASGLLNAALRNFQRNRSDLLHKAQLNPEASFSHPLWLVAKLQQAWGAQASAVMAANNQQAPVCLRVNTSRISREAYLAKLQAADIPAMLLSNSPQGLRLKSSVDVASLPGFSNGEVSVQDEAAQLSAALLELEPGQRVLDACCAPGGKTCHILESETALQELICLDLDASRMARVTENLQRLQLNATQHIGDAASLNWWDGKPFDRILLDAPCSATGVIRRHPDIKLLRREDDLAKLSALQQGILSNLWHTLAPGGILVYATCSVLPQENSEVIQAFVSTQHDAEHLVINAAWGFEQAFGRQLLPQVEGHDGFYYARLKKAEA